MGNLLLMWQARGGDCPHLLLYGPSGAGKKTLVMAILREMFGASADKVRMNAIFFSLQGMQL